MKHHREEGEKGESAILDNRTYATFFSPLRIFALPRLAMQFRGEKQALREERGDTTAFFFLLSRVVSPLTDGDHKSDRGEIAGKNYQAGETLDTRTRSNRVTGGIRRGKEEKRKEWERSLSRRGGKYSKTRRASFEMLDCFQWYVALTLYVRFLVDSILIIMNNNSEHCYQERNIDISMIDAKLLFFLLLHNFHSRIFGIIYWKVQRIILIIQYGFFTCIILL